MSRFGKRLARLGRSPRPATGQPGSLDLEEAGTEQEGTEQEGTEASMADLRAALSRALGRAPAAEPAARTMGAEPLPFVQHETPSGPIARRRRRRAATAQVGDVPLGAVEPCDTRMLSLLGLTPELASLRAERLLFLDTETSGLGSGTTNVPFLVGIAWYEGSGAAGASLVLEQLFLRERDDEPALLETLRERVAACEAIVSFNGKSFDLPVLRARYVMNGLAPLPERPHLDLLHLARRVHRHRSFKKSLTVLEQEVLGFRRGPDIHGEEVAARYRHFLRSGDEAGLHAVVTHNEHDVVSLAGLTALYGEPMARLPAAELASVARTIHRAGAVDEAVGVAELAVTRGAGEVGLRIRAELAKARGDKEQALADFEALAATVSDPAVRLELAKLYEHHRRQPQRALDMVCRGTGESEAALEHRRARLERKRARLRDLG